MRVFHFLAALILSVSAMAQVQHGLLRLNITYADPDSYTFILPQKGDTLSGIESYKDFSLDFNTILYTGSEPTKIYYDWAYATFPIK